MSGTLQDKNKEEKTTQNNKHNLNNKTNPQTKTKPPEVNRE